METKEALDKSEKIRMELKDIGDPGSEASSPNSSENPLEAAVKARRKDKEEEKETGTCYVGYTL
ncbi:hypothetical protein OS493_036694 [Desmophyllum pertusum]|uniref:Uncharacterized protein n=1 Tax=Desmophyllum pertusum TaxID=174260 RepID=A0A9W9ZJM2_9CNID|nr:hypothetical protein OS493_036694 [Desmophyllum pertusum]